MNTSTKLQEFFFRLTPDLVLNTIESASGLRCTGRVVPLNSMENRVYEVEIDQERCSQLDFADPPSSLIAKFYRPERWSREQILEEHMFLDDLDRNDIEVAAPFFLESGDTLSKVGDTNIFFALFPKVRGRMASELDIETLRQTARLLARMHNVAETRVASTRLRISAETYGLSSLRTLVDGEFIPSELTLGFTQLVEQICTLADVKLQSLKTHRLHGDAHLGNLILTSTGPQWVDFDDMLVGPAVQDIWLLSPGRDEYALNMQKEIVGAYSQMRAFDESSLAAIESLRVLRMIHFMGWIARRWEDPAFKRVFDYFGTIKYWRDQYSDLQEMIEYLQ